MKDAGGGVSTLRDSLAAAMVGGELSERHCEILEAAAGLFAERGYAATSVRDIGEKVGLLGGSLYHYIKSKEALFVRIHDMALQVAGDRIATAMAGKTDPWERLEAACVTMLEIQLDPHSLTMPLKPACNRPSSVPSNTATSTSSTPRSTLAIPSRTRWIGATNARLVSTVTSSPKTSTIPPITLTVIASRVSEMPPWNTTV